MNKAAKLKESTRAKQNDASSHPPTDTANIKTTSNCESRKRKSKKKVGRRRRGKKDVILDFTKRTKKRTGVCDGDKELNAANNNSKAKRSTGKMSLATSSKDYGGNLGLPEKVSQREYESTGQFFKRLDRLVAKAKVEASMEARFDMTLPK